MSDPKKPETLSEDELDAANGAGSAVIDFVEVGGGDDEGAAIQPGSHRRIAPVRFTKRID